MAWRRSLAGSVLRDGGSRGVAILAPGMLAVALLAGCGGDRPLSRGPWRAWLASPGGDIPFGLEIDGHGEDLTARIVNGEESIEVTDIALEGRRLRLGFPHYASAITADLAPGGDRLVGEWVRRSGPGKETRMTFHAIHGEHPRFEAVAKEPPGGSGGGVDGRWRVTFASEEDDSIGIFRTLSDGALIGTFLTVTGDYRYLAGSWDGKTMLLSTFDGAHAFLFEARRDAEGALGGDFWSRDTWHDTWTARPDEEAELADGFEQTRWDEETSLAGISFPDLEGTPKSLADPEFAGRARIIELFGTWCPNCNDAARMLAELQEEYRGRGLSILGLAFEMTGDPDLDAEQVRIYKQRFGLEFPVLLAGTAPKAESSTRLTALDRIRAYPTFIFLDGKGRVEAVYSGFSGPATGADHERLRSDFRTLIEKLLEPAATDPSSSQSPGADQGL